MRGFSARLAGRPHMVKRLLTIEREHGSVCYYYLHLSL